MSLNITREVTRLQRMTVKELKRKYAEVFGDHTNTGNKAWLVKRIAWRLQALEEGDLSERARQRAAELANDADLRLTPPNTQTHEEPSQATKTGTLLVSNDDRLPPPGTILTREYKGEVLQVQVLPEGFEHDGEVFKSLSAVAKRITGSHCNGYHFFRLGKKKGDK
ncbi:MAG: DUF2924 domain-containing protein [Gemmataceae bacterium]